ncbi:MAG: enoyl-CoA hydratase/isomerase family protein [Bdellovibrionales bacterium]|nr:enoyl-CoA hydratase/isomerase family protein [Bdellovibrionales bacterium]
MISNFETLSFNVSDEVGTLIINRPDKLNALNIQVLRELKGALFELKNAPIRGLIVTGEGEKAFIAGADIAEMKPMETGEALAFSELGQLVTLAFEALPYPSIACVNGFALGGGFEMALACDFIFAAKNAVFGLPEVKLGLIPGFGGTQRLMKIVGERRAKEIIFSGRNITSDEARNLGIALEVYADKAQLLAEAQSWFKTTLKNSSCAIYQAKNVLGKGLVEERKEFGNIFQTEDMIEGTAAFIEKRKADFRGKIL